LLLNGDQGQFEVVAEWGDGLRVAVATSPRIVADRKLCGGAGRHMHRSGCLSITDQFYAGDFLSQQNSLPLVSPFGREIEPQRKYDFSTETLVSIHGALSRKTSAVYFNILLVHLCRRIHDNDIYYTVLGSAPSRGQAYCPSSYSHSLEPELAITIRMPLSPTLRPARHNGPDPDEL
jgi:hypothetical protein